MDWTEVSQTAIYGMNVDDPTSSIDRPEDALWDYSRPRPQPEDPLHATWQNLPRFEKCAWYWAFFNRTALFLLQGVPQDRWIVTNMTSAGVGEIRELFDFLELDGFDPQKVGKMLDARINSPQDRFGVPDKFPGWEDWAPEMRSSFDRHAGEMMVRLHFTAAP